MADNTGGHFPAIRERRYASHTRPFLNEYFWDSRRKPTSPQAKGSCSTLASARKQALRAVELYQCTTVRIFNRATGQYVLTYKAVPDGIRRHEGFV
jgi:hypothetical protein